MAFNEDRVILNLTDSELEDLVKKWLARLKDDYHDFERPTASADMGRDAVGFLSAQRYDGDWHNYQCKHLKAPLGSGEFTVELGKMFHYASAGEFILPTRYIFVSPNSAVRPVKKADRQAVTDRRLSAGQLGKLLSQGDFHDGLPAYSRDRGSNQGL